MTMRWCGMVMGASLIGAVSSALACGVHGSVTRTDGSTVDDSAAISSNWSAARAFPRSGFYSLDLGSRACGQVVSLFVGGEQFARLRLPDRDHARVDVVLRQTSNTPVRCDVSAVR